MESGYETDVKLISEDEEHAQLVLQGRVDAFVATDLYRLGCKLIALGRPVQVVCQHVEYIDVSALQILLALQAELRQTGHALVLMSPSAAMQQAVRIAGLGSLLLSVSQSPAEEAIGRLDHEI